MILSRHPERSAAKSRGLLFAVGRHMKRSLHFALRAPVGTTELLR
jgi:hypothetical protein